MGVKSLLVFAMLVASVACTQGHCRHSKDAPNPSAPEGSTDAMNTEDKGERVFVYKYDGSLQCKKGKGVTPEIMAKELKGIPVFSSSKKSDGQMHIQVCGSITGMANVFEIHAEDVKKSEALGFKRWSFE